MGKGWKPRVGRFRTPLPWQDPGYALTAQAHWCRAQLCGVKVTLWCSPCPNLRTESFPRWGKCLAHLCWPPHYLPTGHRAYLQLAIPFTFTQMPSFWQGFGSHGSLKYCGQLWSSRGPVFSTDRFCRPGCPWSRLPGSAFSNKTFPEYSSEICCSWSWRTRPWGDSLVPWAGTSVWLR